LCLQRAVENDELIEIVSIPRLEFWPFVRRDRGKGEWRDEVSIPRLEFWPFVHKIPYNHPSLHLERVSIPRLEFWPFVHGSWSGRNTVPKVSIPRLEFWPFVQLLEYCIRDVDILFQFPGWNSGRLCGNLLFCPIVNVSVSIPRLEFWPFVREHIIPLFVSKLGFNSPVGILAVCALPR